MEHLFSTFKIAVKAKARGFKEPCFAKFLVKHGGRFQMNSGGGGHNFNNGSYGISLISAPMLSQLKIWFLKEHNIVINPSLSSYNMTQWDETKDPQYKFSAHLFSPENGDEHFGEFDNERDAFIKAIEEAFKLVDSLVTK